MKKTTSIVTLEGAISFLIPSLTTAGAGLAVDHMTYLKATAILFASLVAGLSGLKSFLSTTFSNYSAQGDNKTPAPAQAALVPPVVAIMLLCTLAAPTAIYAQSAPPSIVITNLVVTTNVTTYMPAWPGLTAPAPTNTPATAQQGVDTIIKAIESSLTNSYAIGYMIHAPGLSQKWGAGVGLYTPINRYAGTLLRFDYLEGGVWMPQGNLVIGYPITFGYTNGFSITPNAFAGVALPVSGAKIQIGSIGGVTIPGHVHDNNGQASAITGSGLDICIYKTKNTDFRIVADIEQWSGFPGVQQRIGIAYNSHRPGLFGIGLDLGFVKL